MDRFPNDLSAASVWGTSMHGRNLVRRLLLAGTISIVIAGAASGQVSRYQAGHGNVTGPNPILRPGMDSKELHRWVTTTETDARSTLQSHPRESQACIAACERMETALLALDKEISSATESEYKDAFRQMQFAHRDWSRAVNDKTKKYQPPYLPRRSQVKSRMGTSR